MFAKPPRLSPLALQKQLLVAESEVNRLRMSQQWDALAGNAHRFTRAAKTVAWTSAAALLVGTLAGARRAGSEPRANKPSWVGKVIKLAQLANSMLEKFHAVSKTLHIISTAAPADRGGAASAPQN